MTDHKTYAEAYAADAQRSVETLADELTRLASDLRAYASGFSCTLTDETKQTPSSLAADIISRWTSSTGNIGNARLHSLVYNAGKAEAFLALWQAQQ